MTAPRPRSSYFLTSAGKVEKVACRDFRHTTQHGAIQGKTQEITVKYYTMHT